MLMGEKISVLIVDDSAVVRRTLKDLLESDPALSVLGTAADPYVAANIMKETIPR